MALKFDNTTNTTTNKEHLIIFVHGFIGGIETWIRNDNHKSVLDYLKLDNIIQSKFDFAVFDYYTELMDKLDTIKGVFKTLFGKATMPSKNIDVTNIAHMLISEIQYLEHTYKSIVLIGHSMGGLVAKSLIIEEIKRKKKNVINLFISLAVPHKGSNLAVLGKAILGNPQVENLQPLSEKINQLSEDWISYSNLLPPTVYFQGKYDQIVPNTSSKGLDVREIEIVYTDDDHFGIVRPQSKDDIVIKAIKYHLYNLLNTAENTSMIKQSNSSVKTEYHGRIFNSLNKLKVYFDTGMANDIFKYGKVNPKPVFDYINLISESKIFIENDLYVKLSLLYEEVSKKSNSDIAEPMIYFLNNKHKLAEQEISKIQASVNEARISIVKKIEEFLISNENRFR